jgi:hypothetical protein
MVYQSVHMHVMGKQVEHLCQILEGHAYVSPETRGVLTCSLGFRCVLMFSVLSMFVYLLSCFMSTVVSWK